MAEGMAFKAALKTIQTNQVYERIMFTQVKAKEAKGSKGTTKGEGKTRNCLHLDQVVLTRVQSIADRPGCCTIWHLAHATRVGSLPLWVMSAWGFLRRTSCDLLTF